MKLKIMRTLYIIPSSMIHTHTAQDPGLSGNKKEEEVIFWPLESKTGLKSILPASCSSMATKELTSRKELSVPVAKRMLRYKATWRGQPSLSFHLHSKLLMALNTIASLRLSTASQEQEGQGHGCILSGWFCWNSEQGREGPMRIWRVPLEMSTFTIAGPESVGT